MKMTFAPIGALALFFALNVSATEAIYHYTYAAIPGYAVGGAGFAFSPMTGISVTSLGFGGGDLTNQDYQVTMWDTAGEQLATALITAGDPLSNQTRYQTISELSLSANQTYYIGAVGVLSGTWNGYAMILPPDPDATGTISVAPEITFLGSAVGQDANGHFPSLIMPNAFLVGANFQYVVPEPSVLALSSAALAFLVRLRRRGTRSTL